MRTIADCRRLMQTKADFVLQWDIQSLVGGNCKKPKQSQWGTPKTPLKMIKEQSPSGQYCDLTACAFMCSYIIGPYWDNKLQASAGNLAD